MGETSTLQPCTLAVPRHLLMWTYRGEKTATEDEKIFLTDQNDMILRPHDFRFVYLRLDGLEQQLLLCKLPLQLLRLGFGSLQKLLACLFRLSLSLFEAFLRLQQRKKQTYAAHENTTRRSLLGSCEKPYQAVVVSLCILRRILTNKPEKSPTEITDETDCNE